MNALDELLTLTGKINDDPTPNAWRSARESLQLAVANVGDTDPFAPTKPARARRRTLTLAAVATMAAAAVITDPVISVDGDHPGSSAAAASVLREAGAAAGGQEGGWPDAAYWHVTSTYLRDGKTYQRDTWIAHQGRSVLHDTGLPSDPGVISLGSAQFPAGGASLNWDQLYALPTNSNKLKDVLRSTIDGAGASDDAELFIMVGDLLRESPAPPALREALYDVAASVPGVRLTGQITDAVGRTGTAVERDGQTYVIAASNGQLLADIEAGVTYTYVSQEPATTAPGLDGK